MKTSVRQRRPWEKACLVSSVALLYVGVAYLAWAFFLGDDWKEPGTTQYTGGVVSFVFLGAMSGFAAVRRFIVFGTAQGNIWEAVKYLVLYGSAFGLTTCAVHWLSEPWLTTHKASPFPAIGSVAVGLLVLAASLPVGRRED